MHLVLRAFFHVPVIGWLVRDAVYGLPDAKYFFMANLAISFVLLLYQFGYPFLICFALTAAALASASLIVLTAADLFEAKGETSRRDPPIGRKRDRHHFDLH